MCQFIQHYLLLVFLLIFGLILSPSCKKMTDDDMDDLVTDTTTTDNDTLGAILIVPEAIFAAEKKYFYKAIYKDKEGNVLTEEQVTMYLTGEPWEWQPDLQQEAIINYNFTEETKAAFTPHPINPTLNWGFVTEEVTGVIEEEGQRLWIHPFRLNQYIFTEVAPFPEVLLPISIGQKWSSSLSVISGWGIWDNSTIDCTYEVANQLDKPYPMGSLKDVWRIKSESNFSLGTSTLELYYHEKYGFVEMDYVNYEGERLTFTMTDATYKGESF